ncbi:HK97 gp10 family phage protein [Mycobacterium sp. Y57]|uniref:HK97 gp10 family phage protein n=1 Tax=Mycolicibacterium xanthum TaxID=2796469 RepID=UPI001C85A5A0|nr:HK97 gp10 family phage protein [Mycolicibacterium xanthum]MBX7433781.1 HK97 gp10 family phage protein [Mycolicibacterium xanthum]
MTSTTEEIAREIAAKVRRDAELKRHTREAAKEVRDYWRSIAPVRTGAYKASIHLGRESVKFGMPNVQVKATDHKAHWIEYGTGGNTPTPEFACAAKTEAYFQMEERA